MAYNARILGPKPGRLVVPWAGSPHLPWNDLSVSTWTTNSMIHTLAPNTSQQEYYRLRLNVGTWCV
jgi:hypothetical protein